MNNPSTRLRELLHVNAALDEQVKQLIRAEQRIYIAQRAEARQVARLDALNRFAIDVAGLEDPTDILRRAAEVMFALFPFDQCVGFLAKGTRMTPAFVRAAEGREADSRQRLTLAQGRELRVELAPEPIATQATTIHATHREARPLLQCVEFIFQDSEVDRATELRSSVLIVPISRRGLVSESVLVFRRLSALSFHEELPTASDATFLGIFARQVSAALTNARLLADLRVSYERLARAQQTLVERERLAALGELAAVVAHEVRNPLAAIFNSVSMLERLVSAPTDARCLVHIVKEESERLNQIVSDLIDFARPRSPVPREESISAIAQGAIESIRARFPDRDFVFRTDDAEKRLVWVDERMVRQALLNLLLNAVQASREASEIVVSIAVVQKGFVRVSVVDRGAGVPDGVAARIFEPFFTTKPTGTGLGLSVVKRIAESHGGRIELSSEVGRGSTFALLLPMADATRHGLKLPRRNTGEPEAPGEPLLGPTIFV